MASAPQVMFPQGQQDMASAPQVMPPQGQQVMASAPQVMPPQEQQVMASAPQVMPPQEQQVMASAPQDQQYTLPQDMLTQRQGQRLLSDNDLSQQQYTDIEIRLSQINIPDFPGQGSQHDTSQDVQQRQSTSPPAMYTPFQGSFDDNYLASFDSVDDNYLALLLSSPQTQLPQQGQALAMSPSPQQGQALSMAPQPRQGAADYGSEMTHCVIGQAGDALVNWPNTSVRIPYNGIYKDVTDTLCVINMHADQLADLEFLCDTGDVAACVKQQMTVVFYAMYSLSYMMQSLRLNPALLQLHGLGPLVESITRGPLVTPTDPLPYQYRARLNGTILVQKSPYSAVLIDNNKFAYNMASSMCMLVHGLRDAHRAIDLFNNTNERVLIESHDDASSVVILWPESIIIKIQELASKIVTISDFEHTDTVKKIRGLGLADIHDRYVMFIKNRMVSHWISLLETTNTLAVSVLLQSMGHECTTIDVVGSNKPPVMTCSDIEDNAAKLSRFDNGTSLTHQLISHAMMRTIMLPFGERLAEIFADVEEDGTMKAKAPTIDHVNMVKVIFSTDLSQTVAHADLVYFVTGSCPPSDSNG